jgi:hypothetical protein
LNWALGYLINELNRDDFLPYEEPPRKLKFYIFLPSTIVLSGLLAVAIISTACYRLKKLKRRRLKEVKESQKNQQDNEKNISAASPMLDATETV